MNTNINDKISELTTDESMFTAYDVTISLRNDGHHVEHSDVKKIVHYLFDNQDMNPNYDRTSIIVPGTNSNALLYYHVSSDIGEYEPVEKNYILTDGNKTKYTVTIEGRLNIPARMIDISGLNGNVVAVYSENNEIIIVDKKDDSLVGKKILKIGLCRRYDFRIPKSVLENISSNNSFSIKADKNRITISL